MISRFLTRSIEAGCARPRGIDLARAGLIIAGIGLVVIGAALWSSSSLPDMVMALVARVRGAPTQPDWPRNLRLSGLEALAVGLLLVIVGAFAVPRWRQLEFWLERPRVLFAVAAGTLVALWLPVILLGRSAIIEGQRYWWLGDDAMISMRYARNLAEGLGLVWNPGERVEGYSNLLWTLWMAVVHLFPIPASGISLVLLLINLGLGVASVPLIMRLVQLLDGRVWVSVGAVLSFVLSKNIMVYATYGYETALLGFLLLWALVRVISEAKNARPSLFTHFLIAALSLVRADAIVFSGLFYLLALGLNERKRMVLLYSALSFLIPAGQEVFRILYYGEILPNTAYLKTMNWNGKYAAGLEYAASFVVRYAVPILCTAAGGLLWKSRARRLLSLALVPYVAYVVYVGGDAFGDYRFFVPVIPILMILALVSVQDFKPALPSNGPRLALGAVCLLSIPLLSPGYVVALLPYPADPGNVAIGLDLKSMTPENAKIADFWAGSVMYFSERPAIDLLGKADPFIARLPAASDGALPGHNKFDFSHSLGVLKPDYVVSHFKLPVTEQQMREASNGDFAYTGRLYFDPIFRDHCLPYALAIDTWRTVFECRWLP